MHIYTYESLQWQADGEGCEPAWVAAARAAVEAAPGDVGRWLSYAMQHIDLGDAPPPGAYRYGKARMVSELLANVTALYMTAGHLRCSTWALAIPSRLVRNRNASGFAECCGQRGCFKSSAACASCRDC